MRINTVMSDKSMDLNYRVVMETVRWCEKNLPHPKIRRRKELCIMLHRSNKEVYGEYCERNNWLTINIKQCRNVRDVVSTTIHEYTHYIQDLRDYYRLSKQVGYHLNPHEIEAREYENKYTLKCWKDIKDKII